MSVYDGDVNVYFATPAQNGESDAIYVQGISYDGIKSFSENGTLVSTNTVAHKTVPEIGFNSDSIYVTWNSREPLKLTTGDHSAVFTQRIDRTGQRLWGDNGLQLEDLLTDNAGSNPIAIIPATNNILIVWEAAYPSNEPSRASNISTALLDATGSYIWGSQTIDVKTNATATRTPGATKSTGNAFVAVSWIDDESPVRAQNINMDGSLG